VNVSQVGGIVKINGSPATSYPAEFSYASVTSIKLAAVASPGYRFFGWSGSFASKDNPATVSIDCNQEIVASFVPLTASRNWPIWMILGIIIAAMIIIGGITWFVVKNRKELKNTFSRILRSSNTSFVFRLILGGIFIFTGFAKINHISALISEIKQYQMLPAVLASAYGHVLPYLEMAVGVLLVAGIVLRISASIAGLMLISFAAAKIVAMIRGLNINVCNCFGPAVPLLSTQSLAIDIVMLLLAIQLVLFRKELFSIPGWMRQRRSHNKD